MLKILWKRGEIAPASYPQYFVTLYKNSLLQQGSDFLFEISGYSR